MFDLTETLILDRRIVSKIVHIPRREDSVTLAGTISTVLWPIGGPATEKWEKVNQSKSRVVRVSCFLF